jgi:hypothetical protein
MIYRVWSPDDTDESGARSVRADTSAEAARAFVELHDRDDWHEDERRTYRVRDEIGVLRSVEVQLVVCVEFRASRAALLP